MKGFAAICIAVMSVSLVSTNAVNALVLNLKTPDILLDTFSTLSYNPNPNKNQDYWWVTLGSSISPRAENVPCAHGVNGDSTCAFVVKQGLLDGYLRMRLRPGQPEGEFALAQLTEERDAYNHDTPHRWFPKNGHSVVVTVRHRFSPNYKADGTGTAVGSAGFDLWNAATDIRDGQFVTHPIKAINVTWQDEDNLFGLVSGFRATIFDQDNGFIVYNQPLHHVNINDWIISTVIWSADRHGVQSVKFLIDGHVVGETTLANPLPPLTIVLWADNNAYPGGTSLVTEEHYHDVDFVNIVEI